MFFSPGHHTCIIFFFRLSPKSMDGRKRRAAASSVTPVPTCRETKRPLYGKRKKKSTTEESAQQASEDKYLKLTKKMISEEAALRYQLEIETLKLECSRKDGEIAKLKTKCLQKEIELKNVIAESIQENIYHLNGGCTGNKWEAEKLKRILKMRDKEMEMLDKKLQENEGQYKKGLAEMRSDMAASYPLS